MKDPCTIHHAPTNMMHVIHSASTSSSLDDYQSKRLVTKSNMLMNKIFTECLNEGDCFKKLMKGDRRPVPVKQILKKI